MNRRGQKFSPKMNLSLEELMPDGRELEALMDNPHPNPESQVLKNEAENRLHQAVLKIPPQYRFVLVLHDMEGLSTAEVGKVTGLREGTVRVSTASRTTPSAARSIGSRATEEDSEVSLGSQAQTLQRTLRRTFGLPGRSCRAGYLRGNAETPFGLQAIRGIFCQPGERC